MYEKTKTLAFIYSYFSRSILDSQFMLPHCNIWYTNTPHKPDALYRT